LNVYEPIPVSELKTKFKITRELLDQKVVPIESLTEFADYLDWTNKQGLADTVYKD
jgi:hypothetical protein